MTDPSSSEPGTTETALRRAGFGLSDVGRKRKSNEDAFFLDDALGLYVVCDGMGGHAAGEIASQEAIDTVYGMVKRGIGNLHELSDPPFEDDVRAACRLMESSIQAATYMVFSLAQLDAGRKGMGTTLSAILVLGQYAVTAQVGDSRIYRVAHDKVEQLTEDHTLIAWQLKEGMITEQEAKRSPHKNVITRAVGNKDYVQVDTGLVRLAGGDRFLLCSDGLHGYLRNEDVAPIVALGKDAAVSAFIALANERGGKDNITALLVEIDRG
jgi:serine/threonine protein phosphatase PrpC